MLMRYLGALPFIVSWLSVDCPELITLQADRYARQDRWYQSLKFQACAD